MSSNYGKNITISIFGESHGKAIGVTINGLPSGIELDLDSIDYLMAQRAPGHTPWSTPRKESDQVEILSGIRDGYTTGAPLAGVIYSSNTRSADYSKHADIPRPSHADYTGTVRYDGYNIISGGGHFSGRLTAPIVFAGAIARQILQNKGIQISARITSIGDTRDSDIDLTAGFVDSDIADMAFPTIDSSAKDRMIERILDTKTKKDSIGGIIECSVSGMPPGIGSPIFDNMESRISSMLFAIPAIKGVEFGAGFDISSQYGTSANDSMRILDGRVVTSTNNSGGLVGGITNSMPIILRCAIKPTPSIATEQDTVDLSTMTDTQIQIHGRHDPCIVPRAVPVVVAGVAISILDTWMDQAGGTGWTKKN